MGHDELGEPDERPSHEVTLSPFFLDVTEVTNARYTECVDAGACRRPAWIDTVKSGFSPLADFRSARRPVSGVSHQDASSYCRFREKRLPREAEWERAARGDDGRLYPWGDEPPSTARATYRERVTTPVGNHPEGAGPYGHLDLAGNVWEWTADNYDPLAYRRETASDGRPATCPEIMKTQKKLAREKAPGFTGSNPVPTECEFVLRGGAFNYSPKGLRATNRVHHPGRFRIIMAGFRCAKDWPDGREGED